ncbi:hypothetical protein GUITHDRAFT_165952 [Guillardia theta CCMP2712]|uniref:Uncharacterized protein n=1 Tax=Guillardia theta (strain CCMP2712) TaxID=905079 RepID=L1II60_GUITC|nr:hypothetical protein GUITHDRAFT_165952 [Guillardia theta CCMP2712]EKX35505.1 hypothetical protein GUITHDRAFT_165952 [Guillardia theta CCMP2712]|eukprot:XP_005822485.1 hypothetical protein GUITHDRAFT_165952 [Guillardia theta CCMP2712]
MTQLSADLYKDANKENRYLERPKDIVSWLDRSIKDVASCCIDRGIRRRPVLAKHAKFTLATWEASTADKSEHKGKEERMFAERRTNSCKLPSSKRPVRPNHRHSIGTIDGCKKYVMHRPGPFLEASGQCDSICAIDEHGNFQVDGCLKLLIFQNRSPFRKAIDSDGNFVSNIIQ